MTYTITPGSAVCACLHTVAGTLVACMGLHLWADCGKSCGAPAKPLQKIERPRGAR